MYSLEVQSYCTYTLHSFFFCRFERNLNVKENRNFGHFIRFQVSCCTGACCTASPNLLTIQRKYVSPSVRLLCEVAHRARYNRFRKFILRRD